MNSVYKLNKQGDSIQPWHTAFPIWNQSIVPCTNCCFLTCTQVSQEAGKVVWCSHLFKNFPVCCDSHSQRLTTVNESGVDFFFLEFPRFFYDPTDVGNLISGFPAFPKSSLYIWKFLVYILLKPSLKDFEHSLTSVGNEHNCPVVWSFLGIAFLWDRNEYWPFPVLWSLLSFLNWLAYWVQHFNSIIF